MTGKFASPVPIHLEAGQSHHADPVSRFSVSSVQHEIDPLRRVVPTAAAIAAVNVLSLAVCHGKPAVYSDPAAKVRHSRLVKEAAESG